MRPARRRRGVRIRRSQPGHASGHHHVPRAGRLPRRLLGAATSSALGASPSRCRAEHEDRRDPSLLAPDLRRATHSPRTYRARRSARVQADSAADARGRLARPEPAQVDRHHRAIARPGQLPTWANATSPPPHRIGCGSRTSPTFQPGRAFATWRWCSMVSAVASSAERWSPLCAPSRS
jgi:hypothetical protein